MRRTMSYKVEDKGRDEGKLFLITEMAASHAENWAMRALLALMNGEVEVPEDVASLGMAKLAEIGLKKLGSLSFEVAEPLLAELMTCIQIIPDPLKTHVVRPLIESDIEEVATRIKLKWEVLNLHVDFSQAVALSKSKLKPAAAKAESSPVTRMSRK
jgi:hypothetical protein